MSNSFRIPKNFQCPNCGGKMRDYGTLHDQRCDDCGEIYDTAYLIELVMIDQGVTPTQDWDDNL